MNCSTSFAFLHSFEVNHPYFEVQGFRSVFILFLILSCTDFFSENSPYGTIKANLLFFEGRKNQLPSIHYLESGVQIRTELFFVVMSSLFHLLFRIRISPVFSIVLTKFATTEFPDIEFLTMNLYLWLFLNNFAPFSVKKTGNSEVAFKIVSATETLARESASLCVIILTGQCTQTASEAAGKGGRRGLSLARYCKRDAQRSGYVIEFEGFCQRIVKYKM